MSREEPSLSQLMVKYPFTPVSRKFFDKLPIEESFSSSEVLRQAENRLLSSIGRVRYEPHMSELIEFSSFFVAALVASQDYVPRAEVREDRERLREEALHQGEAQGEAGYPERLLRGRSCPVVGPGTAGYQYSMRVEDYLKA